MPTDDQAPPPSGSLPRSERPRKRKGDSDERAPSQAELLVQIAKTKGRLFRDAYDDGYLTVATHRHHETMKLRSRRTRGWLDQQFFETFGRVASAQAKTDALALLEGLAQHDGQEPRPVYIRTGENHGHVYIDLGDETHEVIEVDARGWRIVKRSPVAFVRPKGMLPLPRPAAGGSVDELREFVNVKQDAHFRLLVAWIVAAQRPRGPYPILCIQGEHGSSKSTTTRLVRRLVDPNASPVRAAPRELRDLAIAGRAAHVLAFDNLSGLPLWLSDALCRVATGGGFATRALCTDDEEVIFDFQRPVIVNGIDDVATRPDLADRCLVVMLPAISSDKRRRERDIMGQFAAAAPRIYGAVLTAVAGALAREDHVALPELPRMADFAIFVTAAEPALGWAEGDFIGAYGANRNDNTTVALDADLVAQILLRFMAGRGAWSGMAKDLLDALRDHASDRERESRAWPASPHALSTRLRRAAPVLRELGVDVDVDLSEGSGNDKRRVVALRSVGKKCDPCDPRIQGSGRTTDFPGPHAPVLRPTGPNRPDRPEREELQPPLPDCGEDADLEGDLGPPLDIPNAEFAEWLETAGISLPSRSEAFDTIGQTATEASPGSMDPRVALGRSAEREGSSQISEVAAGGVARVAEIRECSGTPVTAPGGPEKGR